MNKDGSIAQFEANMRKAYAVPEIRAEFVNRVQAELTRRADHQNVKTSRKGFFLRLGLGFAAVLLLAVFFVKLPEGQALADTIKHFFKIATVTEIPITEPKLLATPTFASPFAVTLAPADVAAPTETFLPTPEGFTLAKTQACETEPYGYACKLAWAEKKVGYDIKEFPTDPAGYRFEGIFVQGINDVQINYERISGGAYIYFLQGLGGEFASVGAGVPEDSIQPVMIGEYPGEYVVGMYAARPGETSSKWISDTKYSLRWADGERWYEIDYLGCTGGKDCSAEELIEVALSLVDQSVLSNELRADYLKSVAEAEQVSGLLLQEPQVLPEGFKLSYGTYDAELSQIRLSYHPNGYVPGVTEVSVLETPIEQFWLHSGESWNEFAGEDVDINGQMGKYFSEDVFNHHVTWQTEGLVIVMRVYSSDLWYGGTFSKEQVLEIARSFR